MIFGMIFHTCEVLFHIFNLDALEANLRCEVALLDPGMIRRAIFDMRVRAHKCIANQGGHFEK